jgi:2-dehydropantoate 2-reductase
LGAPHWHILGAGAIGCLFADALEAGGCKTTLVMRTGARDGPRPVVVERGGARSERRLDAVTPETGDAITHLLVTTKAYDVRAAVAGIAHRITGDGVVVLLANGMGFCEQVQADCPGLDIFCGTTTEGAYRVGPQHIRHAGRGETRIGRAGAREQASWFDHFHRSLDNCVWDPQIDRALWLKLAVNSVVNPLTALHGCPNGALATRPDLAAQVAPLCEEVALICGAGGFAEVAEALPATVADVIAATADNRSSMLQDREAGRPTEIDYINGYLLQVADRHGIAAPRNRELVEEIRRHGA